MTVKEFIKDRNEAFSSADKEKIIAYCKKYHISIPEDEELFWAGVHKSVCNLYLLEDSPINMKQFITSSNWLREHGYTESITGGEK